MPRMQLISLLCKATEDTFGEDEPYITINEINIWQGNLNDNKTADHRTVPQLEFNSTAEIRLYDSDWPDSDGYLETAIAHAAYVEMGEQRASFTFDDANYILTFKVIDSPMETGPSMNVLGGSEKPSTPVNLSNPPQNNPATPPVLSNKEWAMKAAEALRGKPIVINTNTKEIHRPDCEFVSKIDAMNRVPSKGSMDGAAAIGFVLENYDGCYYCNKDMHYK